jgi:cysteine desulfurase
MCRALELFHEQAESRITHLQLLQQQFEAGLQKFYPRVVINASAAPRAPHTTNAAFVGLDRQALVMALDLAGVACSTGSACASGSSEPSPILLAMGLANEIVQSSVRFSWGVLTTSEEIRESLTRIESVLENAKLKVESR